MKLLLSLAVAVLVLTGCAGTGGNQALTKAVYVTSVSTGVTLGAARYPEAVPYLRAVNPIICAAADGTNVSPAQIVATIQNSPAAEAVATPAGKLILNGSITLYSALFDQGGTIDNEDAKMWLGWTCEAIEMGLPPLPVPAGARTLTPQTVVLPPHVK